MAADYSKLSLKEAVAAAREAGPDAILQSVAERSARLNPKLNALLRFDAKRVSAGSGAGVLGGVPIAVKDNICVDGWETTCASKILQGHVPPYDATVIEKIKAAGGVIFGQANMDEFAFGSSSETSAWGPVRNPWDLERVPGGSSGGSAAAVAADMAFAALGSDTGGSIRQPAAFCGVVGLKPTYGRISRYGLIAFGSSFDQIGPITKTVEDSALLMNVLAGHDPKDSTSAPQAVPDYTRALVGNVKGLKVGVPEDFFAAGLDPEIEKSVRTSIKLLENAGAQIVPVALPHAKYSVAVYYIVAVAEASSNLGRFDGVRFGRRVQGADLIEMYKKTRSDGFGAEAKRRILLGTFVLSAGYYDAYYLQGQKVRTLIRQDFSTAFEKADLILSPTTPTPPFKIGEKLTDPLAMYLSDIFTIPANLAGVPALSVPCGFTASGLPIGVQLMGRPFEESVILRAAHTIEQTLNLRARKPMLEGAAV
ncbi:MAG: aspartyl/glutamyl-tRNA amidotransferase subunit A [Omnitrophica bacterium GWA2_52_12]|nr:MAG: aspartyl/glutamyl-tRNA amidotransferase subunit A [Omnitrophica bacterium GWA2_52_12]